MMIGGFVLLALLITGVVLLFKSTQNKNAANVSGGAYPINTYQSSIANAEKEALTILNNRFARGEIDEQEYVQRKNRILMN